MDDGGRDGFCLEVFGAGGAQAVTTAVRKTSGRCPPTIEIEAISVSSWCASEEEVAAEGPFRSETDWPEYGIAFLLAT